MKYFSLEARSTLIDLQNDFESTLSTDSAGRYVNNFINDDGIYYRPDEDERYCTVSAAFKALPYSVVKYLCSAWTGFSAGVETYDFLEEYARDFGVEIPTQDEYDSLMEEDEYAATEMYNEAWGRVLSAMAEALIDNWHSLCVIRSKRNRHRTAK